MRKTSINIYEPDNCLKDGYWTIWAKIIRELHSNHWLTYQLFKRDFLAGYKQSLMGVLWAFIVPVISVGTFILLNKSGVFLTGEIEVPYPIYAVAGIAIWQFFSAGIVACANALVSAGPMIVKINFSKKSLVLASMGRSIVSFLIQTIVVGILCVSYRFWPTIYLLLLPILVLPLILLTVGLGFMLSIFNGIVRDIGNALSMSVMFLMFLTPILYARPEHGILALLTTYNPLYYLVAVPRELILLGTSSHWTAYVSATFVACMIFFICLFAFHLTEIRVAERI